VPIVPYTPEHYPTLLAAVKTVPHAGSLHHQPFVDYYYADNDWCRLYMAMLADGTLAAIIGIEKLICEHRGATVEIGVASNFTTIKPGPSAPMLFLNWMRTYQYGCVHGGTADVHAIVKRQNWTYVPGVRVYQLNARYLPTKRDEGVRRVAKSVLRAVMGRTDARTLGDQAVARSGRTIRVEEERAVAADMLPAPGVFAFRLAAPLAHLNWRYATGLSFVRYRVFRILEGGTTRGYAIINDKPDWIMLAHADASDAEAMALGSLLALGKVAADGDPRRIVIAAASHPRMQAILKEAGFDPDDHDRDFAVGCKAGPTDWPLDTSNWSVHFDWTDNGLRTPFLDEPN
jgi:hypothetical protein